MDAASAAETDHASGDEAGEARVPARLAVLFFIGLASIYMSFSPLRDSMMGYVREEMATCRQLIGDASERAGGMRLPVVWSRNGVVGLAFQCPFVAAGRLVHGSSEPWEDHWLSLQPVLMTTAIVTLLFVWCSLRASSRRRGFALALAAGFGTMMWPYAYIGLETTQSFFLLLAGFLALEARKPPTWPRAAIFGACAGIALASKSGSFLLAPPVAYLFWRYFFRAPAASRTLPIPYAKLTVAAAIAASLFAVNDHFRALAWARFGGMPDFARQWLVHDVGSPFFNLLGLLLSPNKGLIVYAPLAILGVAAIPAAWRRDRPVAVFALLTLGSLAGALSFLEMWSDETWGPRYLHSAVAPAVLCLAVAMRYRTFRFRRELPVLGATALGLAVSFLGVFFYYGKMGEVASATTSMTLESFQGDPAWNHVRFQERLLEVWLRKARGRATEPDYLRPERPWDFQHPVAPEWRRVDLRPYASSQSLWLRAIGENPEREDVSWIRTLGGLSLAAGVILLGVVARKLRRLPASSPSVEEGIRL